MIDEDFPELDRITSAFLKFLGFSTLNSSRDPKFWETHLISFLVQDYLSSAFLVQKAGELGIYPGARRELRFLLEMAIKHCYVEQKHVGVSIKDKLEIQKDILDSHKISVKQEIEYSYLSEPVRAELKNELGRLYSELSEYAHLTTDQLSVRLALTVAGTTSGFRTQDEDLKLCIIASRTYAAVLALLCHALPNYVVGDFMVFANTKDNYWYFFKSRYIAEIDAAFDYKAERQSELEVVKRRRDAELRF